MRIAALLLTAALALTWGVAAAQAQVQLPPPRETPRPEVPPETPPVAPATPALPVIPSAGPGCHGIKVLWLEQQIPVQVLVPREVITEIKRPTLEVAYREEKRVVHEVVLKPRDVLREVPFTTMHPCTVTDPHTGHCSTVMKPFTEMRMQKETVFYPEMAERIILVKIPCVREVEEVVPSRTVILEYRTDLVKSAMPIPIPYETPPRQVLLAPQSCPHP